MTRSVRFAFLPFLALFSSLLFTVQSRADSIDEIRGTEAYKKLVTDVEKLKRKSKNEKYYHRKSEYGKLFGNAKNRKKVIEWMMRDDFPYKFDNIDSEKVGKGIVVKTIFRKGGRAELLSPIKMHVHVPHPSQFEAIELELEISYRKLNFREYEYTHKELLQLDNHPSLKAELFQLNDKTCLVRTELSKHAIGILEAKSCEFRQELEKLTETLEWGRLNTKLKL